MEYNYKTLFASRREEFIAILGQDFFATVLALRMTISMHQHWFCPINGYTR